MPAVMPTWVILPAPSRLVIAAAAASISSSVVGGVDTGLFHQAFVVEQRQRAHGGGQRPVLVALLHRLHHREELLVDLGGREDIRRQRLDQLGLDVVVQPAVEQLHHVRPFARRDRGGDLGAVVGIGEMGHRDRDIRVCRLEVLDQLLHRRHARIEEVLPVLDLDRVRRRCRQRRHARCGRQRQCSQSVDFHEWSPRFVVGPQPIRSRARPRRSCD